MKSREMTVEAKGTNAIKMWKSFCGKQAERGVNKQNRWQKVPPGHRAAATKKPVRQNGL